MGWETIAEERSWYIEQAKERLIFAAGCQCLGNIVKEVAAAQVFLNRALDLDAGEAE